MEKMFVNLEKKVDKTEFKKFDRKTIKLQTTCMLLVDKNNCMWFVGVYKTIYVQRRVMKYISSPGK